MPTAAAMCDGPVLLAMSSGASAINAASCRQPEQRPANANRAGNRRRISLTNASLRGVAGQHHREAVLVAQAACRLRRRTRPDSGGCGGGACVHDQPRTARVDPGAAQQSERLPFRRATGTEICSRSSRVLPPSAATNASWRSHFVTDALRRLRIRNPVGQQRIRVLATMASAHGDAGVVREHRRRQRVLREHGEDHRRIEAVGCAASRPSPQSRATDRVGAAAPSSTARRRQSHRRPQASSGASLLPAVDVSSVTSTVRHAVAQRASAGVVINTSPRLSSLTARTRRARGPARIRHDRPGRPSSRVAAECRRCSPMMSRAATPTSDDDPVGHALRRHLPFGLVAVVDQHRAAAGACAASTSLRMSPTIQERARSMACSRAARMSMPARGLRQ